MNARHVWFDRDDVADDILLIKSELGPELRRSHDGFALSRRMLAQIANGPLPLRADLAPGLDVGKHALALLWRHTVNLRQAVHEVLLALRREPIKTWFVPQSLLLLCWRHVLVLREPSA